MRIRVQQSEEIILGLNLHAAVVAVRAQMRGEAVVREASAMQICSECPGIGRGIEWRQTVRTGSAKPAERRVSTRTAQKVAPVEYTYIHGREMREVLVTCRELAENV